MCIPICWAITSTPEGMPGNHVYPETKMPDPLGISGATDAAQRAEIQRQGARHRVFPGMGSRSA